MSMSAKTDAPDSSCQRMPAPSGSIASPAFDSLRPRQRAFVVHYLSGPTMGEQTLSYLAAGYKAGKNVRLCAYRLRTSPKVKAAMLELLHASGITAEMVTEALGKQIVGVSLADFEPYIKGEASLKDLAIRGVNTAAVAKVHVTLEKDGSEHRAVELRDPIPALKLAARLVGMKDGQAGGSMTPGFDLGSMAPDELQRLLHAIGHEEALRSPASAGTRSGPATADP